MEKYADYLTNIHAKLVTPDYLLDKVIKEGTGQQIQSKIRIMSGEVNEVYEVLLKNGIQVILRISHDESKDFRQELWSINQCKSIGVPVPEIVFIKSLIAGDNKLSFCIMEKLAGELLERGTLNFLDFPKDTRKQLMRQAGLILSKIHSVATQGYGPLSETGQGEYPTATDMMNEIIDKQLQLEQIGLQFKLAPKNIRKAMRIIKRLAHAYQQIPICLNHGDFGNKHLFVKDNQITGVIDFGLVRSDIPVSDLAYWDYWFGEEIPVKRLMAGYENQSLFNSDFSEIMLMLKVHKSLELLDWYHQTKYAPGLEHAKKALLNDIKYFS